MKAKKQYQFKIRSLGKKAFNKKHANSVLSLLLSSTFVLGSFILYDSDLSAFAEENGTKISVDKKEVNENSKKPSENTKADETKTSENAKSDNTKPSENATADENKNNGDINENPDIAKLPMFNRVSGENRIETSIKISNMLFPKGASTVVLVNGDKYADVLSAVPFTKMIKAPILYTETEDAPKEVVNELKRLGAGNIILIGGNSSVSQAQMATLQGMGYNVERIWGYDKYQTSYKLSQSLKKYGVENTGGIIIASGQKFPDALSATTLAVENRMTILLTSKDELERYVAYDIAALNTGSIYIVGGKNTISEKVESRIKAANKDIPVNRIAGNDRYDTSVAVAKLVYPKSDSAIIASGKIFQDALIGSQLETMYSCPILLTEKENIPVSVKNYIKDAGVYKNIIVGGRNVLTDKIVDILKEIE